MALCFILNRYGKVGRNGLGLVIRRNEKDSQKGLVDLKFVLTGRRLDINDGALYTIDRILKAVK